MDIGELIWIFVVIFFLYRLFFAPSKPRREDRYDVPSEPSYEESESSTKTRDDILEEMRTIFGGESTTEKPKPSPAPKQTTPTPAREQSARSSESKYASYSGTNFIDARGQMSEADEALKDVEFRSRSLEEKSTSKQHSFDYLFDQNEIRKGIIISEILAKPKSMRKRNI
jgi:hypothetical protein